MFIGKTYQIKSCENKKSRVSSYELQQGLDKSKTELDIDMREATHLCNFNKSMQCYNQIVYYVFICLCLDAYVYIC